MCERNRIFALGLANDRPTRQLYIFKIDMIRALKNAINALYKKECLMGNRYFYLKI